MFFLPLFPPSLFPFFLPLPTSFLSSLPSSPSLIPSSLLHSFPFLPLLSPSSPFLPYPPPSFSPTPSFPPLETVLWPSPMFISVITFLCLDFHFIFLVLLRIISMQIMYYHEKALG